MTNKLLSIKERILYLAENVEVNKQEFFKKIDIIFYFLYYNIVFKI